MQYQVLITAALCLLLTACDGEKGKADYDAHTQRKHALLASYQKVIDSCQEKGGVPITEDASFEIGPQKLVRCDFPCGPNGAAEVK